MKALFLLLFFSACASPSTTEFTGFSHEIAYRVVVGEKLRPATIKSIEESIHTTFQTVDRLFNNWNPHSEISKLNRLPAGKRVSLSPELEKLLLLADKIHHLTQGKFDPTVEPLEKLWKQYLRAHKLPPEEALATLLPAIGWDKIHIEEGLFWKDHPLAAIDLGGIAKGYAVDQLMASLQEKGLSNLYVDWGGEIKTQGAHPEGRPWRVGIRGLTSLEMQDTGLATSGDYFQCWEVEGEIYTHIIDPKKKCPLKKRHPGITSATVQAKSCAEADALATALMLFDTLEEATTWAHTHLKEPCWLTDRDISP